MESGKRKRVCDKVGFHEKAKESFSSNSGMAKTEEKFLLKGKVFLVRAYWGREVAMEIIGKW